MAKFNRARSRAFWTRALPLAIATSCAIRFHWPVAPLVGVAIPCQNRAASVWSAVRAVLSIEPRSLIMLKAAVYSGLVSAGGGGGRNCEPLCRQKGVTWGHWGATGGA